MDEDEQLALLLQEQYFNELNNGGSIGMNDEVTNFLPTETQLYDAFNKSPPKKSSKNGTKPELSIVAPEWEDLDPTPDLHAMFLQYNQQFFWGKLNMCEVRRKKTIIYSTSLNPFFNILNFETGKVVTKDDPLCWRM